MIIGPSATPVPFWTVPLSGMWVFWMWGTTSGGGGGAIRIAGPDNTQILGTSDRTGQVYYMNAGEELLYNGPESEFLGILLGVSEL
jgi:hypothetical protein